MDKLPHLFENNRKWAERRTAEEPDFFRELSKDQNPEYLWIGCADSRVPANEIVGLSPGDLFVHRNIANLVIHSDLNGQSVIQYAVEALKVKHVIVCGHYGCGGVKAATGNKPLGLIDNWVRHIKDIYRQKETELQALEDEEKRIDRLCELNVEAQVYNVCHTPFVQQAWADGQELWIHGWIYNLSDGLLKDLDLCIGSGDLSNEIFKVE